MKRTSNRVARDLRRCLPLLALASCGAAFAATPINLANYPLFLAPPVKPNVLIMFDNSQSMDATMSGKVISGSDPETRGNIARTVLRGILDTYKDSFDWGLGSFAIGTPALYNTHAYYIGSSTTMVYTNKCDDGIDTSHLDAKGNPLRCIANPQTGNGYNFITYSRSGDDADINDVLYSNFTDNQLYGRGTSGTSYKVFGSRTDTTGWADSNFSGLKGTLNFTPTDAGFLPQVSTDPRQIWIKRGWGYYSSITGKGVVNQTVQPYSAGHFTTLNTLLGNETNTATGEIKNSAVATPLAGTLLTAKDYFSTGLSASQKSPIAQSCQKNFVVMATDGNPTGKTDGSMYSPSQWANTKNEGPPVSWTWGQAQLDVFSQITALRNITLSGSNLTNTSLSGSKFDVQTYVIGMGDSVKNESSKATLDRMADLGGGYPTAFLGSDSTALIAAFQAIVGDIQGKISAASSVALNSGKWITSAAVYQAKFNSTDWSGDVVSYAVQASGVLATTPTWQAASAVKGQDWDTGRAITTYKPSASAGSRGIAFRWPANASAPAATELDAAQVTALNKTSTGTPDVHGEARLKYLRGDTSKEIRNCTACTPQFRSRPNTPLGDIVNSSPFFVGAPLFPYTDDFESVPYSSFAATYRVRTPIIYAGANDGMLHGFRADTGAEVFAYVPSMVIANLPKLTAATYTHQYFVDGSPTVGDVFYASAWHSLLVSGLRAGGKGLFALDVTNPTLLTEANAANIVRWEFTDPDMGYVFGQPLLVKANTGKWVVVVSGGYNSGSTTGRAMLFVIDAETGALVRKIDTLAGTAASPNGLSAATAIDTNGDQIVDVVYAGDIDGNMWKFDLSGTTAASWGLGNGGLALFKTQNNQPITNAPDVTRFPSGGYLVTFGTGRYIDTVDIALPPPPPAIDPNPNNSPQSFYGVWDNLINGTVALDSLQQQSFVDVKTGVSGNDFRLSTHAVDPPTDGTISGDNVITKASYLSTKRGWYVNLPTTGERVVSDSSIRGGRVIFSSIIPDSSSACAFGGIGWVLEVDVITGNRFDTVTFDTNGDNSLTADDLLKYPGSPDKNLNSSGRRTGLGAAPAFMSNKDEKDGVTPVEDKYINTVEGIIVRVRETAGRGGMARVMWREVK